MSRNDGVVLCQYDATIRQVKGHGIANHTLEKWLSADTNHFPDVVIGQRNRAM